MNRDPIASTESLVQDIRAILAERDPTRWAVLYLDKAAMALEELLVFHRGYKHGAEWESQRLSEAAKSLLTEMQKLREGGPRGPNTEAMNYIRGHCPRLFELESKLRDLVE